MTKKQEQQEEYDHAMKKLHEDVKAGDTVWTSLDHVSQSGMMREISLYIPRKNKITKELEIASLTYYVGVVSGRKIGSHGGLRVGGCGMDMGFHVVYGLSRRMFPKGFGIVGVDGVDLATAKEIQPKTKTMAQKAVDNGATFYGRNGDQSGWDDDGGYALDHRWL